MLDHSRVAMDYVLAITPFINQFESRNLLTERLSISATTIVLGP